MSFTYEQLKDAVKNYTEYTETTFVANIPLFIRLSEERILKTAQLSLFRRNSTAQVSGRFLKSPSDFLAPFSLSLSPSDGDRLFLDFKDPSFLQMFTPKSSTTGVPRYYCQFDYENFMLAPAPATVHTAELHYFYRPPSITQGTDSETTWLSVNAEMALLYGALIEAYIYMKGESDILDMYNRRFQESMLGVKMLGEAKETTDEYRTGKVIRDKQ